MNAQNTLKTRSIGKWRRRHSWCTCVGRDSFLSKAPPPIRRGAVAKAKAKEAATPLPLAKTKAKPPRLPPGRFICSSLRGLKFNLIHCNRNF